MKKLIFLAASIVLFGIVMISFLVVGQAKTTEDQQTVQGQTATQQAQATQGQKQTATSRPTKTATADATTGTTTEVNAQMSGDQMQAMLDQMSQGMDLFADGIKEGTMAPDFELTPLKFIEKEGADDSPTRENAKALYEKVKLSSYRDKKPVALIFGSYT